jgi:hypothetical protein
MGQVFVCRSHLCRLFHKDLLTIVDTGLQNVGWGWEVLLAFFPVQALCALVSLGILEGP